MSGGVGGALLLDDRDETVLHEGRQDRGRRPRGAELGRRGRPAERGQVGEGIPLLRLAREARVAGGPSRDPALRERRPGRPHLLRGDPDEALVQERPERPARDRGSRAVRRARAAWLARSPRGPPGLPRTCPPEARLRPTGSSGRTTPARGRGGGPGRPRAGALPAGRSSRPMPSGGGRRRTRAGTASRRGGRGPPSRSSPRARAQPRRERRAPSGCGSRTARQARVPGSGRAMSGGKEVGGELRESGRQQDRDAPGGLVRSHGVRPSCRPGRPARSRARRLPLRFRRRRR